MNSSPESPRGGQTAIAMWLFICAALVFAMVVLGGATRLTHSGLSMVDWRPITGFLPPLHEAEWQGVFARYQAYPEYQKINAGMTLDEFKNIFWFEYSHRLLGRLIGIVFLFPFLYFAVRRQISRLLYPKLILMFVLGGLQGGLGWYMVKSGMVDRPDVSHLRLAAHLGAAFIIFGFILWVALGLLGVGTGDDIGRRLRPAAMALIGATFVVALSGALVAGLDAGFHFNTFPLMGDSFVPEGLGGLQPWWHNLLDNRTTVQFDHRLLAESLFLAVVGFFLWARRLGLSGEGRVAVHAFAAAASLQAALGITTLVLVIPVPLAIAHQAGALILFGVSVWVARALSARS